ncbi:MAG: zf-HC2 domain-containing protein [Candidatus Latescibacteria bacterium]|nr:zf-HC2 domain-containing protein [Candidatus Latescibacterota bacterium]
MDCKRLERYLSRYLEGELEGELKDKVEEHLSRCSSCARKLHRLEAITGILRGLGPVEPPENFVSLLSEKLQKETL